MKGALVCLRSLGIEVRGSLEDPEVARWLVEPAVDELTPLQPREVKRNKRKTAPAPPPRTPPESLILDRWVSLKKGGRGGAGMLEFGNVFSIAWYSNSLELWNAA